MPAGDVAVRAVRKPVSRALERGRAWSKAVLLVRVASSMALTSLEEAARLVEAQLGYSVTNLVGIAAWTRDGMPAVIETYPLRRNHHRTPVEPFPTLFWLSDRRLSAAVSAVEARGGITQARAEMRARQSHLHDLSLVHARYKRRRWALLNEDDRMLVESRGWVDKIGSVGVAGLRDHTDVKCLHAHYANFLADMRDQVQPVNPLGKWVHDRLPLDIQELALCAHHEHGG